MILSALTSSLGFFLTVAKARSRTKPSCFHLGGQGGDGLEVLSEQVPVPGVVVSETVELEQQVVPRVLQVHQALVRLK